METEKGIEKGILERFKIPKEEINNVLDVINKEVEKSSRDGLVIGEKDLVLEKFYFLCVLEQWASIDKTKVNFGVEDAIEDLDERIKTFFQYFKLEGNVPAGYEQQRNQQKYTAHLEAVKKGIISLIFESK